MTRHLVSSLVDNDVPFDPNEHRRDVSLASVGARKKRLTRERLVLEERGDVDAATKKRDARACNAGLWLSVYPSHLNSTVLSTNEWRDNVRLRYNHIPLDMPKLCDGCGAHMTVEHALSCKKGGLVSLRHDGVADEWRHLCGCGFTPGRVERKLHIYSSANCTPSVTAGLPTNSNTTPPINPYTTQQSQQLQQRQQQQQQLDPEPRYAPLPTSVTGERGDASCQGFWEWGRNTIFYMRITDTEARFYRNKDFTKVLAAQEKRKRGSTWPPPMLTAKPSLR